MANLTYNEVLIIAGVGTAAFILISYWFSAIMNKRGWSWQVRAKPKRPGSK
jgi:hypothetical protein